MHKPRDNRLIAICMWSIRMLQFVQHTVYNTTIRYMYTRDMDFIDKIEVKHVIKLLKFSIFSWSQLLLLTLYQRPRQMSIRSISLSLTQIHVKTGPVDERRRYMCCKCNTSLSNLSLNDFLQWNDKCTAMLKCTFTFTHPLILLIWYRGTVCNYSLGCWIGFMRRKTFLHFLSFLTAENTNVAKTFQDPFY